MKKTSIAALLTLGFTVNGNAQSLERQVFASAGGFVSGPNGSGVTLSYTIGESVVATVQSGSLILTQGFQQPDQVSDTTGINQLKIMVDYTVYPNPTNDRIFVTLKSSQETDVMLDVYDITGRKLELLTTKINVIGTATRELSLKELSSGTYLLVMSDMQGRELKNFKVEKLN